MSVRYCVRPTCGRKALNKGNARGLCRQHHTEFVRRRRAELGPDWFVDTAPLRQHIEELRAAGLGYGRVAALAGYHADTISDIAHGKKRRTTAETAAKILALEVPPAIRPTLCHIPAIGTQRRLQALVAFGYSHMALAARLGIGNSALGRVYRQTRVTAQLAHNVDALFRELQLIPGPDRRARLRAQRMGWALPLAWDEDTIDDPAAQPAGSRHPEPSRRVPADFADQYAELRDDVKLSDEQIAARLGISYEALLKRLSRMRIPAQLRPIDERCAS
jgi:hypothetical protein